MSILRTRNACPLLVRLVLITLNAIRPSAADAYQHGQGYSCDVVKTRLVSYAAQCAVVCVVVWNTSCQLLERLCLMKWGTYGERLSAELEMVHRDTEENNESL